MKLYTAHSDFDRENQKPMPKSPVEFEWALRFSAQFSNLLVGFFPMLSQQDVDCIDAKIAELNKNPPANPLKFICLNDVLCEDIKTSGNE